MRTLAKLQRRIKLQAVQHRGGCAPALRIGGVLHPKRCKRWGLCKLRRQQLEAGARRVRVSIRLLEDAVRQRCDGHLTPLIQPRTCDHTAHQRTNAKGTRTRLHKACAVCCILHRVREDQGLLLVLVQLRHAEEVGQAN